MTEPTKLKKPLVFKLKTTIDKDTKLPYYGQQIPVWNESGECMLNNTKIYLPHHKEFKNEQLDNFYKKYNHNPEHGAEDLSSKIKTAWQKGPNGKESAPNVAQEFVKYYMRPESIVKGILLYHNLGSGKTRTAIETVKQYIPHGITPLVILPASLTQSWKSEITRWDNENISKYEFISYNASNSPEKIAEGLAKNTQIDDISSLEIIKGKKYFVIIDEAHNFMSSLTNASTKRASLYATFMKFTGKIMCLTATPTINKPFELALFFNILKGYLDDNKNTLFPENEHDFKNLYSDKPKNRAFMYRINGMVSYYVGNLMSGEYPEQIIHPPELIQMTDDQLVYYNQVRGTEEEVERFSFTDDIQQSYRSGSRMASNFVFPVTRPKPRDYFGDLFTNYKPTLSYIGKWNPSQIETLKRILTPEQYSKFEEFYRNPNVSVGEKLDFLQSLYSSNPDGINNIYNQDDIQNYTVFNTKRNFGEVTSYASAKQLLLQTIRSYPNFIKPAEGADITISQLNKYSSKYQRIFDNIVNGPGNNGLVFVYSAFKELEGLTMFSFVLEYSSYMYTNMTPDIASSLSQIIDTDEKTIGDINLFANRYLIYSGDISQENRNIIKKIFTHPKNSHGQICKIFLGTAAAAEGLDLKCIQQVHIMEPHWNYVRIQQVIGRAVRFRSHISLPENERKVHIYQYLSVESEYEKVDGPFNKGESTDLYLYKLALQKNSTIKKFLNNVKNSSVDCDVLKYYNNSSTNVDDVSLSVICNSMAVSDNILFKKNGADDMDDVDFVNETEVLSTKYYKSIIKYGNISQTVYYLLDINETESKPKYNGHTLCWKLRPSEQDNGLSDEKINELNCTDKWQHMHLFEPKTFKMIKTDKVRITCPHNDTGVTTRYEKYDENIHFHNKIN